MKYQMNASRTICQRRAAGQIRADKILYLPGFVNNIVKTYKIQKRHVLTDSNNC